MAFEQRYWKILNSYFFRISQNPPFLHPLTFLSGVHFDTQKKRFICACISKCIIRPLFWFKSRQKTPLFRTIVSPFFASCSKVVLRTNKGSTLVELYIPNTSKKILSSIEGFLERIKQLQKGCKNLLQFDVCRLHSESEFHKGKYRNRGFLKNCLISMEICDLT